MIKASSILLLVVAAAVCCDSRVQLDEVSHWHSENIKTKLWFDSEVNLNITFFTRGPTGAQTGSTSGVPREHTPGAQAGAHGGPREHEL